MKLRKKFKITLIFLLICLILMIAAAYAWVVLSVSPEVTRIDTNVGANGSLEIALLTDETYVDPVLIRTTAGSSALVQDAAESNLFWGNVIDLSDEGYGLGRISLLPARLNVSEGEEGAHTVNSNMLKVAEFGLDGRISILSSATASAVLEGEEFTYFVDEQRYGVRAIGTLSNLTPQQTALAGARTALKSHTAAASRTVKYAWRDAGPGIMDLLYSRYFIGSETFTVENTAAIRTAAVRLKEALSYVDSALRQGIIGMAATQIQNESDFETLCTMVSNTSVPLSMIAASQGENIPEEFQEWIDGLDEMRAQVQSVISGCDALTNGGTWDQLEPLMDVLLDADQAYLGEKRLSTKDAFDTGDNVITLSPSSGVMAKLAAYAGNYSAFCMWTDTASVEARSTDPNDTPYLIRIEDTLEDSKAATGGWTRTNLNDTYGFAIDMAFRCNLPSDLLLQTSEALRVAGTSDLPVTQGGGSYMRFTSEGMETEQLLRLMDTIRIGFLNDKNNLVGLAKLNVSNYEEQEDGVFAPLYLYEYRLEEDGSISVGERRSEDTAIVALEQNSPVVLTVVAWLDGDHVDNSMVGHMEEQSMSGVLNLQFASSADLLPSNQTIRNEK